MKKLLLILLLAFLSNQSFAQTTAGFEMLNSAPSTAALSKGGTSAATSFGAASSYLNPSLLVQSAQSSLDFSYSRWIGDYNYIFGGANFVKDNRAFAISFYSAGEDGFEQRNSPGEPNGSFSITYLSINAAAAYDLNLFSLGLAVQYLSENNYLYQANGYAFNFGISKSLLEERLNFGASVLNIGKMEELVEISTELPANIRAGFSFDAFTFTHKKNPDLPFLVNFSTDFVHPLTDAPTIQNDATESAESFFAFATSITVAETIEVNAGYKTGNTNNPLSFGVGLRTELLNFNYALIPFNTGFGTVHSVGLQYQF